jgi:hypothetical protein
MFCVFHPTNAATAHCSGCNRPLCAACDHRIKAQPYCEDCIVRGVDILRRPSSPVVAPAIVAYPPRIVHNAPSPAKATMLALVPGLGAVYNRQNLKALFHFIGTVGLFEIGGATDLALFVFGGVVFFLYTVMDANRSAREIAAGADPRDDERRIKWAFARYKPAWGLAMIVAALLAIIPQLPIIPGVLSPARIWAALLFLGGLYMIFAYFRSLRTDAEPPSFPTPPRSVVSSALPGDVGGLTSTYTEGRSTSHLGEH